MTVFIERDHSSYKFTVRELDGYRTIDLRTFMLNEPDLESRPTRHLVVGFFVYENGSILYRQENVNHVLLYKLYTNPKQKTL